MALADAEGGTIEALAVGLAAIDALLVVLYARSRAGREELRVEMRGLEEKSRAGQAQYIVSLAQIAQLEQRLAIADEKIWEIVRSKTPAAPVVVQQATPERVVGHKAQELVAQTKRDIAERVKEKCKEEGRPVTDEQAMEEAERLYRDLRRYTGAEEPSPV